MNKKAFFVFFATGAYLGYSPFAPGTVGTLWGVALAYGVSSIGPPTAMAAAVAAAVLAAVFFAGGAEGYLAARGGKDPSSIVCDEVAGFMVAALFIPFTPSNMILAFILFRFFDILKPFPVRTLDRMVHGGWGIVLDDVAAGVYANVAARLIMEYVL